MKKLVISHGGACADGFTSAWLFARAWPDAEILFAQHGEPPPDVAGKSVVVVDFSYPHDVMRKMLADTGGEFVVLDHHRTAEKELAGLEGHYVFDTNKSGARLAWEYLHAIGTPPRFPDPLGAYTGESPPWVVLYVEDRDLWRWSLPDSREVNAALRSYARDFAVWDGFLKSGRLPYVAEGHAILRAEDQEVAKHVRNAGEITLAGHRVLCVNATTLHSEIAGELAKGRPFGVVYFDRADGFRVYSLRERDSGVDVSAIAKLYGGGGHRSAAGFQIPGDNSRLFAEYLANPPAPRAAA